MEVMLKVEALKSMEHAEYLKAESRELSRVGLCFFWVCLMSFKFFMVVLKHF